MPWQKKCRVTHRQALTYLSELFQSEEHCTQGRLLLHGDRKSPPEIGCGDLFSVALSRSGPFHATSAIRTFEQA